MTRSSQAGNRPLQFLRMRRLAAATFATLAASEHYNRRQVEVESCFSFLMFLKHMNVKLRLSEDPVSTTVRIGSKRCRIAWKMRDSKEILHA